MFPKSVSARWLDHADPKSEAYDIEAFTTTYGRSLPNGYTRNHYFEFETDGTVSFKLMPNSPDLSFTHQCFDPEVCKARIMSDLFGCSELSQAEDIALPTLPRNLIKASIVKSLAENMYPTIPAKHLTYYPTYDRETERRAQREEEPGDEEFVRGGGATLPKKRKAPPTQEETREGLMITVQNMGLSENIDLSNVPTETLQVIASATSVSNAPKKKRAAQGAYVPPPIKGQRGILMYCAKKS